jgi:putative glutamine amidotransferase
MTRPIIGVTVEFEDGLILDVERGLREPLARAGALVILLPRDTPADEVATVLDMIDGVQLSGGADVHPTHYGADQHELTIPVAPGHDAFELGLAAGALERGMPIIGLCRGAQVLAVADGGTLTQDVATLHPGARDHTGDWNGTARGPEGEHWHDVVVEPGSNAERWFASGPRRVNTFHHQCVASTGRVLVPTVRCADDDVIEATERRDGRGFAAGLQWHNEMMWQHDERFLVPHAELVAAARAYRASRNGSR